MVRTNMTRLFGTNGIRGIVNQEMNGELALGIGMAWGTYLKHTIGRPKVAIGTDARLSNHMLKSAITAGFLATGCDIVDVGLVPTPTLQYTVKEKRFDSGVIITASHNPPQYNGIKGTAQDGAEYTKDVEEVIETNFFSQYVLRTDWKDVGVFSTWDGAIDLYLRGILSTVDVALIKKQGFHVVLDCGNGVGSLVAPLLLKKLGCTVTELYCKPDGRFPGRPSEPIPENLSTLLHTVPEVHAAFGIAQDGDADRAIFIDEKGTYLWGDKTLSLAGKYTLREKNGGVVVTPVTTSSCFEEVIRQNGGTVIYSKVGSPIVAQVMKESNAVFGGEENGGLIFPEVHYCRDATLTLAKILEILARKKKPLSELIDELPRYEMYKTKLPCSNERKQWVMEKVLEQVNGDNKVLRIDRTDGVKLFLKSGWVLLRPSGTEPIFRVYAEAKSKTQAEHLASTYIQLIESLLRRIE
jgi:phosphomannomutase/phosphoglucomutase